MRRISFLNVLLVGLILFTSCKRRYSVGSDDKDNKFDRTISVDQNKSIEGQKKFPNLDNPSSFEDSDKTVAELFKVLEKSVFMVFSEDDYGGGSQGSGFLLSNNIGITNFHVVDGGSNNSYVLINNDFYRIGEFLDYSNAEKLDYAIFRINNFSGKPLRIANTSPEIGEDVFTIGSPRGLQNSLTKGTISGFRDNNRIQIDATIDHGSSGGALFNLKGEIIGITTAIIGDKELNFAVDIQAIPYKRIINQ